ncbi:MAG: hypothetical protein ACKOW2_04735 [Sphingobacteriaceae bacterium]
MSTKMKWLLSLVLALATAILMQWQGSKLKTAHTPLGIVSLELTKNTDVFKQIMSIWDYATVQTNIWIDFLFIPAYTFFFIQSLNSIMAKNRLNWVKSLGKKLMTLAWLAAALDVIENIFMLSSIAGHYSASSLYATATVATCKFACIGFIILYLIGSIPLLLFSPKVSK